MLKRKINDKLDQNYRRNFTLHQIKFLKKFLNYFNNCRHFFKNIINVLTFIVRRSIVVCIDDKAES